MSSECAGTCCRDGGSLWRDGSRSGGVLKSNNVLETRMVCLLPFGLCVLTDTQGRIDPDLPGPKSFPDPARSPSFEDEEDGKADETSTQRLQEMVSKSLEKLLGKPVQRVEEDIAGQTSQSFVLGLTQDLSRMNIESKRSDGRGAKECLDTTAIVNSNYARYPQEKGAETGEIDGA